MNTKTKYTAVVIALVLGIVLTTAAFIGTFFFAGVSDFGTVSAPKAADSVRFRNEAFSPLNVKQSFFENFIGYDTEIVLKAGSDATTGTATGTEVVGVIKSASTTALVVDVAGAGSQTIAKSDIETIKVRTFNYGKADWGQKIFYFHVPIAIGSFLIFLFAAYFAVRFLMTKNHDYDTRSRIAMEVSFLFIILTMATGILWTKAAWGVWWEWEPRLTTYAILTLLTVAYFVLRSTVEDAERRATYAAAFCILAAIDVPISFGITRILPSTHPVIERGGLEGPMLASFLMGMFGMMLIAYVFYELRLREEFMREKLESIKSALEG